MIFQWDIETRNLVRCFAGLSTPQICLAVGPNGKYLLAGTANGELVLWDLSTGEELHRMNMHSPIYSEVFSPDNNRAYATGLDGKLFELQINEKSLSELQDWIKDNRYLRELTCEERQQYHVDPQCKP